MIRTLRPEYRVRSRQNLDHSPQRRIPNPESRLVMAATSRREMAPTLGQAGEYLNATARTP